MYGVHVLCTLYQYSVLCTNTLYTHPIRLPCTFSLYLFPELRSVLCTAEAGQCSVYSHSHQLVGEGCWGQGHKRTIPLKGSGLLIATSPRNGSVKWPIKRKQQIVETKALSWHSSQLVLRTGDPLTATHSYSQSQVYLMYYILPNVSPCYCVGSCFELQGALDSVRSTFLLPLLHSPMNLSFHRFFLSHL